MDFTLNIKVQPESQAACKGNKAFIFSLVAEGGTGPSSTPVEKEKDHKMWNLAPSGQRFDKGN